MAHLATYSGGKIMEQKKEEMQPQTRAYTVEEIAAGSFHANEKRSSIKLLPFSKQYELLSAVRTLGLVGVTGFEPAASCSQSKRATNCATPRYLFNALVCLIPSAVGSVRPFPKRFAGTRRTRLPSLPRKRPDRRLRRTSKTSQG